MLRTFGRVCQRPLTYFSCSTSAPISRREHLATHSGRGTSSTDGPRSNHTIFAVSSGSGKCGVSVIRLSGPHTQQALCLLLGKQAAVPARKACVRRLHQPISGEVLDEALVLWMPGPASFTGEDVAELQCHGSIAVLSALMEALGAIPRLQMAEAGEFTRRAFHNGRLDLTAVEGLADLIHSETEAQRRQALRQMQGELSALYRAWSERLLKCVADVTAVIDFGEEEAVDEDTLLNASSRVAELESEISGHLRDRRRGERLRNGVHVTIAGAPNVGKSSVLNLLCQRPAAIVSPVAGTTRDVVESALNLGGYPVVLSDTAGLRTASDAVERDGIERAHNRVESGDLVLLVVDAAVNAASFTEQLSLCSDLLPKIQDNGGNAMLLVNKADLVVNAETLVRQIGTPLKDLRRCVLSCKTSDGVDDFLETLTSTVKTICGNPLSGNPSLTQARHRQHLQDCVEALHSVHGETDLVIAASSLQIALQHIAKITGKVCTDDILDVIFRDFCIGK